MYSKKATFVDDAGIAEKPQRHRVMFISARKDVVSSRANVLREWLSLRADDKLIYLLSCPPDNNHRSSDVVYWSGREDCSSTTPWYLGMGIHEKN